MTDLASTPVPPPQAGSFRAVVVDIEGTTTPISFVYDALFPYARHHVAAFLATHWQRPDVAKDLELLADLAQADLAQGLAGAIAVPRVAASDRPEDVLQAAVASVVWQMDQDRKTTALKSLQGKIWQEGYARGELKGVVFADVPRALAHWQAQGIPAYIYSSGSVDAQKLLFGHSTHGDLMPLLSGYFDTTTGPKREAQSYLAIAEAIGQTPAQVVFATDNLHEALAAREAGMQAVMLERPGNPDAGPHDFACLRDFEPLMA